MKLKFTIATTQGTSLHETRQTFVGTLIEAKAKALELLSEKKSASVNLLGTCYFLAFASGKIAIDK